MKTRPSELPGTIGQHLILNRILKWGEEDF
jgi:hypothetical protein